MKLGSRDELKRPNGCVLILLMLIPVLALVTIADNVAVAACTCPYGGQYFSSIYTKLCGWQYNVCVSFDYNCGNDYQAVCAITTTTQSTYHPTSTSSTSHTTSTSSTTTAATTLAQLQASTSCDYIAIMMGQCSQGYNNQPSTATSAVIGGTGTSCDYIAIMMGQCSQGNNNQPSTIISTTTRGTSTQCDYIQIMTGQCPQGYTP